MKLVSFPVVSAFALSTFQPSLPQVKMPEQPRFACKSPKFKHTAYARWLALCLSPFLNTHTICLPPSTHTRTKLHSKSNLNLLELHNFISRKCTAGQFWSESLAEVQIQVSVQKKTHTVYSADAKSTQSLKTRHADTYTHKSAFNCLLNDNGSCWVFFSF